MATNIISLGMAYFLCFRFETVGSAYVRAAFSLVLAILSVVQNRHKFTSNSGRHDHACRPLEGSVIMDVGATTTPSPRPPSSPHRKHLVAHLSARIPRTKRSARWQSPIPARAGSI